MKLSSIMQSVLLEVFLVLSLQGAGCWTHWGPTAPLSSDNPTAPASTQAPLRRADFNPEEYTSLPCAKLLGDASVSNHIFNCPEDQRCGMISRKGHYWGCCKNLFVVTANCDFVNICPTYSSCIDSTALGSCDSDCMTDLEVLKCSDSAKPVCAVASASLGTSVDFPEFTTMSQYACANHPYTLHYTVIGGDYLEYYEDMECAPEWFDSITNFEEYSSSIATEMTAQDFANPFDHVVARANFSASTGLPVPNSTKTSAPTVRIPTAPSATSMTTTSGGIGWVVPPRDRVYIYSLLFAGGWLLS